MPRERIIFFVDVFLFFLEDGDFFFFELLAFFFELARRCRSVLGDLLLRFFDDERFAVGVDKEPRVVAMRSLRRLWQLCCCCVLCI
jgi:hypothetical protein